MWQPPIDPATGEALWDQVPAPSDSPTQKGQGPAPGSEGQCRRCATAAGAAGAAGAVGVADHRRPRRRHQPGRRARPTAPAGRGSLRRPATKPAPKRNRPLITVLVVVLVVLIGGIAYFAVKRNNNSTSTTRHLGGHQPLADGGGRGPGRLGQPPPQRPARPAGCGRRPPGRYRRPPVAPVPPRPGQSGPGRLPRGVLPDGGRAVRQRHPARTDRCGQVADLPDRDEPERPDVLVGHRAGEHEPRFSRWRSPSPIPTSPPASASTSHRWRPRPHPGATAQVQAVTLSAPAGRDRLRVPDHLDHPQPGE